jgi:circadian clock protein KaiB
MAKEKAWKLMLYVADETPACLNASNNLQRLCDEQLKGNCEVEVIDILRNPETASDEQIVAIPTLIKKFPLPVRRVIGGLSNTERLFVGLDIRR